MYNSNLTAEALLDLRHMFSDDDFRTLLFTDEKEIARHIEVHLTGEVTLGKTKYKLINRLFKDEKTLSTNDICIKLIQVITGKGGARNNEAFKSLIKDLTVALDKKDYSYVITRIFLAYRLGYKNDVAAMHSVANAKDEIVVEPNDYQYVMVKDGFNVPYAIKIGKYR